jgi:hypothetical protein
MTKRRRGQLIIPEGIKPYPKPHEIYTARVLVDDGHTVIFLNPDNRKGAKTADIELDGERWELKSPTGGLGAIERNLKRGSKQSCNIVFDCRRMKIKSNDAIKRELITRLKLQKQISKIIFISRYGKIIDINKLI